MRPRERGFLLLGSHLGNPDRRPLTAAQLHTLADRVSRSLPPKVDRQMEKLDLQALGYGDGEAERILSLLEEEALLDRYLARGKRAGCKAVTRISDGYPLLLRKRLGLDGPAVLWARGEVSLLNTPAVALVGCRELARKNAEFAYEVGRQAALQGLTLVSGNARGADRTAQESCLAHGGSVIAVVADELERQPLRQNVLYLSEDGFGESFSSQRAISRNRCIHSLGWRTFVAQAKLNAGGTWSGTEKNLRGGWSEVYCFNDGSEASIQLAQMGAHLIETEDLMNLAALPERTPSLFD